MTVTADAAGLQDLRLRATSASCFARGRFRRSDGGRYRVSATPGRRERRPDILNVIWDRIGNWRA
jgi:hypothetical protein